MRHLGYGLRASKNHEIPLFSMSHRSFVGEASDLELHDSKPLLPAAVLCAAKVLINERNFPDHPSPLSRLAGLMPGMSPASSHSLLGEETAVHE